MIQDLKECNLFGKYSTANAGAAQRATANMEFCFEAKRSTSTYRNRFHPHMSVMSRHDVGHLILQAQHVAVL